MLLVGFFLLILAVIGRFLFRNRKRLFGTENRHRHFATVTKDFPLWHNEKTMEQKKKLFEPLQEKQHGKSLRILEIGAASGANLQFFPEKTVLSVVDPNPFFREYLEENLTKYPNIKLESYSVSGAEDMKTIPDHSIDAVVSTLVLCSVSDVQTVLKEIKRVLIPGGKFLYMEHVVDDSLSLLKLGQILLSCLGIFPFLIDGCHCDRDIEKEVRKAGFAKANAKRFRIDLSDGAPMWAAHFIVPHEYGVATTKS